MLNIMQLHDEQTWPIEVIDYLDHHHDLFLGWELGRPGRASGTEYDKAIYGLRAVLRVYTDCALHGYHCTRLTRDEIQYILSNGMQMPNPAMLNTRIDAIERAGMINTKAALYLRSKNQGHASYRVGMLWFCFFQPYIVGQSGIERFFRSWGGEALYNGHERDPLSGPILKRIGVPCIVEAYVPIASLAEHGGLDFKMIRRYLVNRGLDTCEPLDHEDRAKQAIPPENVARIIEFPDSEFIQLTRCDLWEPKLT